MLYTYAYFTGCLILLFFWSVIFFAKKELRREMTGASFLGMPFGFIEFFLVPTYWNPDSLFELIEKYGVGIESFLFFFAIAGIASVMYQLVTGNKPVRSSEKNTRHHYWILISALVALIILSTLFPEKAIYSFMSIGVIGIAVLAYLRPDLRNHMAGSASLFSVFYIMVFVLINFIFKGFVEYSYHLENTLGILVIGIPLEEIAVSFFLGAFWSAAYMYAKNLADSGAKKMISGV